MPVIGSNMDRAMAIWGGGAAITLAACARPSSCSAVPSRVRVGHPQPHRVLGY